MSNNYDFIVIGSGPSGLVAAAAASSRGIKTLVLERNEEAARKIYATGNGRCNFLNRKAKDADMVLEYCHSIGIIETEEEDGRLYPRSMQAASVADALINAAKKNGAEILCGTKVCSVQKKGQYFDIQSEKGELFTSDKLLIATGGKAGIQFGCYGDGYKWAQDFGHVPVKPIPALTGLECAESIELLHGVRIKAKASVFCNKELLASDLGEVQFAGGYISGICVMNLSRYLRTGEGKEYTLVLDLFPEYSKEDLLQLLLSQKKIRGCATNGLIPSAMHEYLHTRINPEEHGPVRMAELSKNLCFTITGSKGWKDAQVTAGGVRQEELSENYESKLAEGLYFAGEILDYDGPCGGYNIGHAILTGLKVGKAV